MNLSFLLLTCEGTKSSGLSDTRWQVREQEFSSLNAEQRNGKESSMTKPPTFTQTLMRLIRKMLNDMAAEDGRSIESSRALYEASNAIGRNHVALVTQAAEAVQWQKQLQNREAANVR